MGNKQRKKIWAALYALTALTCLVNYCLLPETVVAGIRVANGVRSLTYATKGEIVMGSLLTPLAGLFLWNTWVKRVERKIAEHPNLNSYRIRRFWAVLYAWFCSGAGLVSNIAVLIMNL